MDVWQRSRLVAVGMVVAWVSLPSVANAAPGIRLYGAPGLSEIVPNNRLDSGEGVAISLCLSGTDSEPTPPLTASIKTTADIQLVVSFTIP